MDYFIRSEIERNGFVKEISFDFTCIELLAVLSSLIIIPIELIYL
jgi:hypothetical protein